ncbi:MAG: 6,7-dimethyl-8-ribityllumazine synthase [Lentisphaeria bacterium]|nr:6,7-dimethyl-8-ribityllumazine synthase [Lentisphaeria bacterium]
MSEKVYEGSYVASGLKIGVVCGRFNELFTTRLVEGAKDVFVRSGGNLHDFEVAWVPGSFEVPLICEKLAKKDTYDAIIALGLVITGKTSHADHINSMVASSIGDISRKYELPVVYGVVTAENLEQAMERAGTKLGNRGSSACQTAIEMANLIKQIDA